MPKLLSFFLLSVAVISCASRKEIVVVPPQIQQQIADIETELDNRRDQGHNLLSPGHYKDAYKSLKTARKDANAGKDRSMVIQSLNNAQMHLQRMREPVALGHMHISDVLQTRQAAMMAQATELRQFQKAEGMLEDLGYQLEKKDINQVLRDKPQIRDLYYQAEVLAVSNRELGKARANLKASKDMKTADQFKDQIRMVEHQIQVADAQIKRHPRRPNIYRPTVKQAHSSSRRLLARVTTGDWIADQSIRQVVDSLESDFEQIAKPLTDFDSSMLSYEGKIQLMEEETTFVPVLKGQLSDRRVNLLRKRHNMPPIERMSE